MNEAKVSTQGAFDVASSKSNLDLIAERLQLGRELVPATNIAMVVRQQKIPEEEVEGWLNQIEIRMEDSFQHGGLGVEILFYEVEGRGKVPQTIKIAVTKDDLENYRRARHRAAARAKAVRR